MFSCKRSIFAILLPILALTALLTACGNATTGSSPTPTPAATATATSTPTPAATPLPASAFGVKKATGTVNGQSVTILTNANGWTLYYYKPDTATKVACTGGCAQNWPPLLYKGSGMPTSSWLGGTLSVVNGGNGAQVEFNGHPLYAFKKDTKPGDMKGEAVGGVWYVATTSLPAAGGSSAPTPTPTSTSSGYGY